MWRAWTLGGLSTVQIVQRGGWKTDRDLADMTGKMRFEVNSELSKSGELLKVTTPSIGVMAIVLGGSATVYHAASAELRALAESGGEVNFADLPRALKISLIKALEQEHNKHSHASTWMLSAWMSAELALEDYLESMDLCIPRPRPEDGLYFPCFWHARGVGHPWGAWREKHIFLFEVAFTGTLNTRIGGLLPPDPGGGAVSSREFGPHGELTVNESSMAVRLSDIAEGGVDQHTLRVARHSSRSRIVSETKRLLIFYGRSNGPTAPFMPLDRTRFNLLSHTEMQS